MHEEIVKLAQAVSGAGETEGVLLELLCDAAEQAWTRQLRPEVTAEGCGAAFLCAAAFTATADLAAARSGEGSVTSFTAGEVSIQSRAAAEAAAQAQDLRETARRMMLPYIREDTVLLRGVKG